MDERLRRRRLLTRAGFGPRPGQAEALEREGAEAWLARQLAETEPADPKLERRLAAFPSLGRRGWQELVGMEIPSERQSGRRGSGLRKDSELRKELGKRAREISREVAGARVVRAVHGRFALREVMLDFWSNHFSVFGRKALVGALLPHYEREVLLPFVLGRFEDLLIAVARSPAMLVYLDNWSSTTPALPRWARRFVRGDGGINENYARELLELHTLGVDGGYSQGDVVEVARVFTGWTLESRRNPSFRFRELLHDPGTKHVMGARVEGQGIDQGERLLRRLARHPSTARHLARKLAARFVADAPPPALVGRAARRYLETDGDLREVVSLILHSSEFADPAQRKLKTPLRFTASALRATGGETDGGVPILFALGRMGEVPYYARTPAGYPEETSYWVDPGAVLERMGVAFALASGRLRGTALGPASPAGPARSARRAGSRWDARALSLAAPEFQWA